MEWNERAACHLLTVHNVRFQMRLMGRIRESLREGIFPEFVRDFMKGLYPKGEYPEWSREALKEVGIELV